MVYQPGQRYTVLNADIETSGVEQSDSLSESDVSFINRSFSGMFRKTYELMRSAIECGRVGSHIGHDGQVFSVNGSVATDWILTTSLTTDLSGGNVRFQYVQEGHECLGKTLLLMMHDGHCPTQRPSFDSNNR